MKVIVELELAYIAPSELMHDWKSNELNKAISAAISSKTKYAVTNIDTKLVDKEPDPGYYIYMS